MMTEQETAFVSAVMDIGKAVAENDTARADELCAAVNQMELTEEQEQTLGETVALDRLDGRYTQAEAYLRFVEGLDCITDKSYRVKMLRARTALESMDQTAMGELLEEALSTKTLLDPVENDYAYVSMLLRMCLVRRDYDAMERLRGKLVE